MRPAFPPPLTRASTTEEIAEAQRRSRTLQLEECLQAGRVEEAIGLGWRGNEEIYHLVRTGEGTTTVKVKLSGSPLGIDVSNDRGIAVIAGAAPSTQLQAGDIIRAVNNVPLFTCEAVLGAIRNAQTTYGAVSLRVGRPKPDTEPHIPRPPSPAIRAPAPPPTPPESMHEEEQGAPPGAAAREQPSLDMPLLHVPTAASSKQSRPADGPLRGLEAIATASRPLIAPAAASAEAPVRTESPNGKRVMRRPIAARDDLGADGASVAAGHGFQKGEGQPSAAAGPEDEKESLTAVSGWASQPARPPPDAEAAARASAALAEAVEGGADLVDLICAIATHGEAAAESEALQRALARRDELAAEPSAEAPAAAAPAPVDPTVLSLTFDNLQLLDCATKGYLSGQGLEQSVRPCPPAPLLR